jgi:hypothetical protein
VFVSHNMAAIQRLCSRVFVIDHGRLVLEGDAAEATAAYLDRTGSSGGEAGVAVLGDNAERFTGTGVVRLRRLVMTDLDGQPTSSVRIGQRFRVTLTYEASEDMDEAIVELGIGTPEGQRIVTVQNTDLGAPPVRLVRGLNEISVELSPALLPGEFALEAALHRADGITSELVYRALRFTALNVPEGDHTSYPWPAVRGYVRSESTWSDARPVPADASALARG